MFIEVREVNTFPYGYRIYIYIHLYLSAILIAKKETINDNNQNKKNIKSSTS